MASQKSDITLYTTQTPNGIKISITLEELGCVFSFKFSCRASTRPVLRLRDRCIPEVVNVDSFVGKFILSIC
jgi:hypothetical protein